MITTCFELQKKADTRQHAVPCPACNSTRFSLLMAPDEIAAERAWLKAFYASRARHAGKDQTAFTQGGDTSVVRCLSCGTLTRNPQPDAVALHGMYAHDRYTSAELRMLASNLDRFYAAKAHCLRGILPPGSRVLEVGSFIGSFLFAAEQLGWRALGVDIGIQTSSFARDRGLKVVTADLNDLSLEAHTWDAVFVWNTFEQIGAPQSLLQHARELLKPNGLLVVRVPNGEFKTNSLRMLHAARSPEVAEKIMAAQAYNNFLTFPYLAGYTQESLRRLLREHHFDVRAVHGDTLTTLAGPGVPEETIKEQAHYKRTLTKLCRQTQRRTQRFYYPWLDLIASNTDEREERLTDA